MRRYAVCTLIAAYALAVLPSNARGQTTTVGSPATAAAAESLYKEARALMAKGNYADACPKLEESLRLDSGIGTEFHLADCNEHIGKIASAWAGFLDVAASARAAHQTEREKLARKRAQAIEARVPKLFVDADASQEPGLEISRDGNPVGHGSWGSAIAIDPGTHDIVASARELSETASRLEKLAAQFSL